MARVVDPEGREAVALSRFVDCRGKDVIDIGCGEGRTSMQIARTAASVLGVDPDGDAIARARDAARDVANDLTFLAADAVTLDLPDASRDVVLFSRSL